MFSAYGDVGFISAHHDLLAGPYHLSVFDSGVQDGFFAAPADGRDFFDFVRQLQKPFGALEKQAADQPQPKLSYMLILDGEWCRTALRHLHLQPKVLRELLKKYGVKEIKDVFYLQYLGDGSLRLQLKEKRGAKIMDISKKEAKELCL